MKGVKLAASIISIVEGAASVISGIMVTIFGAVGVDFFVDLLNDYIFDGGLDRIFPDSIKIVFIVIGAIFAVLGLLYLIFGIKFCSDKSKKGTAITLLILSVLLCNIPVLVLTIVYLVLLAQQNQNHQIENR